MEIIPIVDIRDGDIPKEGDIPEVAEIIVVPAEVIIQVIIQTVRGIHGRSVPKQLGVSYCYHFYFPINEEELDL